MLGAIWAQSRDRVIGDGEAMPWHVPEDLAHFKSTTMGFPVIMGRHTWLSLPEKVRPLPGRDNTIVCTTEPGAWCAGATTVTSPAELSHDDAWIIGGAGLYAGAIDVVDVVELTLVDAELGHLLGDRAVRAPELPADLRLMSETEWRTSDKGRFILDGAPAGPVRYKFLRYERTSND